MDLEMLPEMGLELLRQQWGAGRSAKAKHPPVALGPDGPLAVYYLRDVASLRGDTIVVWSWPGQWRNDVYQTTLAAVR